MITLSSWACSWLGWRSSSPSWATNDRRPTRADQRRRSPGVRIQSADRSLVGQFGIWFLLVMPDTDRASMTSGRAAGARRSRHGRDKPGYDDQLATGHKRFANMAPDVEGRRHPEMEAGVSKADLIAVATAAQAAGRQEVNTSMEAHDRYQPTWEVREDALQLAVRNGLLQHYCVHSPPRPRVVREYSAQVMGNLPDALQTDRPVDLAVLFSLQEVQAMTSPNGYAWNSENTCVMGLIEVKKDWRGVDVDIAWLDRMARLPPKPGTPPLQWVLMVSLLGGHTSERLLDVERAVGAKALQANLPRLTECIPQKAPSHAGTNQIGDLWFEVMCYGRSCLEGV